MGPIQPADCVVPTTTPTATLFDQIGGQPAVDAVVDYFYDNLLQDGRVKGIFANTNMARQRQMQKSFVTSVLGGGVYKGKTMRVAHRHLNLTDEHFDAVAENLEASLKFHKVAPHHVVAIMKVVESTRKDVLGRD